MKPFDPRTIDSAPLAAEAERALREALARTAPQRRGAPRPALGSLVGLGLSLALLAGLAIALAPTSPVAEQARR